MLRVKSKKEGSRECGSRGIESEDVENESEDEYMKRIKDAD